MEATVFKHSSLLCMVHTASTRLSKEPELALQVRVVGYLYVDQLRWVELPPIYGSSGLQITLKRPGQGYRFLWGSWFLDYIYGWIHKIYQNKASSLIWGQMEYRWRNFYTLDERNGSKSNYYFELWKARPAAIKAKAWTVAFSTWQAKLCLKWTCKVLNPYSTQALECSNLSF